jgi:hypothetical protein
MEIWDVVALVLGSNVIMGVVTFFATKIQVKHSDKRLEKELERQREADTHTWRREVEGKPLFKLREELAVMATKYDRVVGSAYGLRTRFDKTEEAAKNEFQEFLDDINVYIKQGSFSNILAMQYNKEIINRVDEIIKDYLKSYSNILHYRDSNAEEQKEAMRVFDRNKNRIIEVQELINKKLEEL